MGVSWCLRWMFSMSLGVMLVTVCLLMVAADSPAGRCRASGSVTDSAVILLMTGHGILPNMTFSSAYIPVQGTDLPRPNSNSLVVLFYSHPNSNEIITPRFCTWHDSCAVMTCAKFWSDLITNNLVTAKQIFHRIWILSEKLLRKWSQCL